MKSYLLLALVFGCACLFAQSTSIQIDLRKIGHIAPKGRVQDKEYNPSLSVIDRLIKYGPPSIPFLVSKLEDTTPVKYPTMDYWPALCVGDVAWIILCDLFTKSDWEQSTIDPSLDSILEMKDKECSSAEMWFNQVKKDGRLVIRIKIQKILDKYRGNFIWDAKELCFKPAA